MELRCVVQVVLYVALRRGLRSVSLPGAWPRPTELVRAAVANTRCLHVATTCSRWSFTAARVADVGGCAVSTRRWPGVTACSRSSRS